MHLTRAEIPEYIDLAAPDAPADERTERATRLQERVDEGEYELENTFVAHDGESLVAAVGLASVGGTLYSLIGPWGDATAAARLVAEALARALALFATGVSARPRADESLAPYAAALSGAGFDRLGLRIEFKTLIANLPDDEGTPLTWRSMSEIGSDAAAAQYAACAAGDPHGLQPEDDPRAVLDSYLSDPSLTTDDDCVAIGYLDDEPVAFVCAQVAPSDGWSRITYMGLVESARGRGLGRWVHRRGFAMMRAQGGELYHGGTAAENAGMLRLFVDHGCDEVARLEEFEWHR